MACKNVVAKSLDEKNGLLQSYAWLPNMNTSSMVYALPTTQQVVSPLSSSLLQQLNAMAPKEFLTHILTHLTEEQMQCLMFDEKQRRKTFLVRWPHIGSLSGVKMAQAGFYYLNVSDKVRCVFCCGNIFHWVANDNPTAVHGSIFPSCRFVQRLANRNQPCPLMLQLMDCPLLMFFNNDMELITNEDVLGKLCGVSCDRAQHFAYAPPAARLKTFERWPTDHPVKAPQLCEAGFYYSGFNDQVYCFFCAGGLNDWQGNDNPWQEHARWYPDCPYLVSCKGHEYVSQVHQNTPIGKKVALPTREEKLLALIQLCADTRLYVILCCQSFGYSAASIDIALQHCPAPENNITEFVDRLASCESFNSQVHLPTQSNKLTENIVKSDSSGDDEKTGWLCSECGSLSANRLCLPCGHHLLCERCTTDVKKRVSYCSFQPKCLKCGIVLITALKVFF